VSRTAPSGWQALVILARLRLRLAWRHTPSRRGPGPNRLGSVGRKRALGLAALLVLGVYFLASVSGAVSLLVNRPDGRLLAVALLRDGSIATVVGSLAFALPRAVAVLAVRSDARLLLATPLPARLVFLEKLLQTLAVFVGGVVALGLAAAVPLVHALGGGPGRDVLTALVLACTPVVPVSAAFLAAVVLKRYLPGRRADAVTAVVGGVLALGVYAVVTIAAPDAARLVARLSLSRPIPWWHLEPAAWPGAIITSLATGDVAVAVGGLAVLAGLGLAALFAVSTLTTRLWSIGFIETRPASHRGHGRRMRPETIAGVSVAAGSAAGIAATPRRLTTPEANPSDSTLRAPRRQGLASPPAWWLLAAKEVRTSRRDAILLARAFIPLAIFGGALVQAFHPRSPGGPAPSATFYPIAAIAVSAPLVMLALTSLNREAPALRLLVGLPISARDLLLAKLVTTGALGIALAGVAGILAATFVPSALPPWLGALSLAATAIVASAIGLLGATISSRLDVVNLRKPVSTPTALVAFFGTFLAASSVGVGLALASTGGRLSAETQGGLAAVNVVVGGVAVLVVLTFGTRRLERLLFDRN
jgi:hypothetical protein